MQSGIEGEKDSERGSERGSEGCSERTSLWDREQGNEIKNKVMR